MFNLQTNEMESDRISKLTWSTFSCCQYFLKQVNRPFLSCPQSLFQSKPKCKIFVVVISCNFNINEN